MQAIRLATMLTHLWHTVDKVEAAFNLLQWQDHNSISYSYKPCSPTFVHCSWVLMSVSVRIRMPDQTLLLFTYDIQCHVQNPACAS